MYFCIISIDSGLGQIDIEKLNIIENFSFFCITIISLNCHRTFNSYKLKSIYKKKEINSYTGSINYFKYLSIISVIKFKVVQLLVIQFN